MRAAVPAALVKVPSDCLFIDSRADTDSFLSLQFESCMAHYSRISLGISTRPVVYSFYPCNDGLEDLAHVPHSRFNLFLPIPRSFCLNHLSTAP
jgi:hypothetical protein